MTQSIRINGKNPQKELLLTNISHFMAYTS
jgi:hypothetical protein